MTDLLATALDYAAHGLAVFPARVAVENGRKIVRPVAAWRDASTTNAGIIRSWFAPGRPLADASLCIDCGKSKIVVIDLDVSDGKDGIGAWGALVAEHEIPITPLHCKTPSGGEHWYYRENERKPVGNSTSKIAPGVDTRGLGGFVFAFPSVDSRGAYGPLDLSALATAPIVPDFVVEAMGRREAETPLTASAAGAASAVVVRGVVLDDELFAPREFTRAGARAFLEPSTKAFEGLTDEDYGYNARLNALACLWSHFVPAFWSVAGVEERLYAAAVLNASVQWQGELAVRATIRSGLRQTHDPWKAVERDQRDPADDEQATGGVRARMLSRVHDRDSLDTIQPPTALIDGVLDVATLAMLAGKFGTFKTFLSIGWALSVATGAPWFGHEVTTGGPAFYVVTEGASGFRQRVRAWEIANLDGGRVPADRLVIYNGAINLASIEQVDIFAEIVTGIAPALIVFDTLHKCIPGLDEQGSVDMSKPLDRANRLREDLGATILFDHHTGHSGERSRGSSALEDDIDTSWVVKLAGDQEDRSPENQRVLSHRKAKDHELLDDVPLLLRAIEGSGSCVVERAEGEVQPGGLEWIVTAGLARKLDDLGVPRKLTIKETKRIGERAGLGRHAATIWAAIARQRREPQAVDQDESDDD